ncbi:MAG TPA: serine hydrolase domain-containing protein [Xanthobacteraceae bacterium]|nr:serine hydrolase domain-containing protein [Xanthobacteraceae bacterium]
MSLRYATRARAQAPTNPKPGTLSQIDSILRAATSAAEVPGVVALAATDRGILYEGIFGKRRLGEGTAMTRDTVFRVASMVKVITSVAALQLVEQNKLSLDAPVPDIEPAIGSPQVLDGFDAKGLPQLRPAQRPITLRHLLTHTSGFAYRLWDAKAVQYAKSLELLPKAQRKLAPSTPLMFDPGTRWQYGTSIDWVGRIVQAISGETLDVYFRKHILDPLGMSDTAFVIAPQQRQREASVHRRGPGGALTAEPMEQNSPRQSFSGGGGIYSTAPDYLTLIRALLAGGALDGARILRPETVALMGQNQIGEIDVGVLKTTVPALSNDVDLCPGVTRKWGFGHMITMQAVAGGRSAGSLTWGGLLNTYYWIDPGRRVAAVFMTQVLPFADGRALRLYRQFEHGIYAALS